MAKARKLDGCVPRISELFGLNAVLSSTKALSGSCKKARLVKVRAVSHSPGILDVGGVEGHVWQYQDSFQRFSFSSHCNLLNILLSGKQMRTLPAIEKAPAKTADQIER